MRRLHGADQDIHADRHVKGCVCLSSGYDFVRENSYLHVPGNFMGPKYDSALLHYWKGYLKLHQAQLSRSPDIDVHAGLHAKSLEVRALLQPCMVCLAAAPMLCQTCSVQLTVTEPPAVQ